MDHSIQDWISERVDRELARPTRIHPLPELGKYKVFIKREDELSSGISGSKLRKYASLLPFLRERSAQEVALIGGPNSNNLLGLAQALREIGVRAWFFVREPGDRQLRGNSLLLDMLADPSSFKRIERSQWENVLDKARDFVEERKRAGRRIFLVPEGAAMFESLAGSLTLAQDVLRNERESGIRFRNLFVDSGTGMSAMGLILGLAALDPPSSRRRVYITLIAGDEGRFAETMEDYQRRLVQEIDSPRPKLPQIAFLEPPIAPAFGSVNESLFAATREVARTEGLLMDPVYSVKHYMSMRETVSMLPANEASLFIYNGSSLGLAGFQDRLVGQRMQAK